MALSPHSRSLSPRLRHRLRFAVPGAAAVATVLATALPQTASGSEHPSLPTRTAAQLLAAVERATLPSFTGTTVETARLGLPSLPAGSLRGAAGGSQSRVQQMVTLLTGSHTAHLAYAGPDQQRAAIFLDDLSEIDVVHNGKDLWTYSSQGNAVTHTTLTDDGKEGADAHGAHPDATVPLDPTKAAEQALAKIDPSTAVTVDPTARVAGRSAYQLVLTPRDARSLVGSVRVAIDAATSMPLRVQIWPRGGATKSAFEVGFTSLTLRTPSASTFAFTAPPGATVDQGSNPLAGGAEKGARLAGTDASSSPSATAAPDAARTIGKDWLSILTGTMATPAPKAATSTTTGKLPDGGERAARDQGVSGTLDQLGTVVPGGRLITTALVTILLTDDGRYYVGAVDPAYLQQVAAQGHA
jgi:outer membrane lipoprotein-sorting protein